MNCPKCGNELSENQKFCTQCGTEITDTEITKYDENLHCFVKSKSFIISAIVLLVFILISVSAFACNKIYNNMKHDIHVELPNSTADYSEYKSIKSIYYEISNMTPREALENIIQQENDLKEFLAQNHAIEDNDRIFAVFYSNLIATSRQINKIIRENYDESFDTEKPSYVSEIEFTPIDINKNYFKATNPNTNLIKTVSNYGYDIEVDYLYIFNTYSKYLTKPTKDYLSLKKEEQVLRDGYALWQDGTRDENITRDKLVNYIVWLRGLINNYPTFELWEYALEDIKIYTDALICISNYDNDSSEEMQKAYNKFLKIGDKNSDEYATVEKFSTLNQKKDTYMGEYDDKYKEWYNETFDDNGIPRITQYDINMHTNAESEYEQKIFNTKVQAYKDLKLSDNGALTKYINDFNKRKNNIELVVFPAKNNNPRYEYGSSYPMQLAALGNAFNDLELYTYQKIADTYKNNYEHGNKLKAQAYHDYYNQVVQKISNSEYFAKDMKKYINGYDTRKNLYREIVSNKMKDTDFSIWFDKLELYTYHVILTGLCHLGDFTDEIQKIFEQ